MFESTPQGYMAQSLGYNCMCTQNNMKPTVRKTLGAKKTPGMKNLQPYPQNVYTPGERLHVKGHGTSAHSLQKAGTKIPRKDDPLPQKYTLKIFFKNKYSLTTDLERGTRNFVHAHLSYQQINRNAQSKGKILNHRFALHIIYQMNLQTTRKRNEYFPKLLIKQPQL